MTAEEQWNVVSGIGLTALAVAAARALESQRPDALMHDPYAVDFITAARPPAQMPVGPGAPDEPSEMWSVMAEYIGVRSRFFDDFVLEAVNDGVDQVVVLAAGLDTRAYRLDVPGNVRWYELDQPLVLEFKHQVLRENGAHAGCTYESVPIDLRRDWGAALEAAGFDAGRPSVWLAEGLLAYLPPDAENRLFHEISRLSAPGSRFAVEHTNDSADEWVEDATMNRLGDAFGADVKAMMQTGGKRSLEDHLTRSGWNCDVRTAHARGRELGRELRDVELYRRALHTVARRGG
ncbi:SAM-dependent methyltransferase [Streptomyces sp. NPDC055607]